MPKNIFVVEIACHTDAPEDYSVITKLEIPEIDNLLYALPDKPNERYAAGELRSHLKQIKFKRAPELVLILIDKGSEKSRALVCPLTWPKDGKPGMILNRQVFDLPQKNG